RPTQMSTPSSVFLDETAADIFEKAAMRAIEASTDAIRVTNAYSIKTDPDARLIRLARKNGFHAEAISIPEVAKALENGYSSEDVILNGPAKWWQSELVREHSFLCVFCDSLEELATVSKRIESGDLRTKYLGIRLRTPNVFSRFGISVSSPADLQAAVDA